MYLARPTETGSRTQLLHERLSCSAVSAAVGGCPLPSCAFTSFCLLLFGPPFGPWLYLLEIVPDVASLCHMTVKCPINRPRAKKQGSLLLPSPLRHALGKNRTAVLPSYRKTETPPHIARAYDPSALDGLDISGQICFVFRIHYRRIHSSILDVAG